MKEFTVSLPTPFPAQKKALKTASRFNALCAGEHFGKTTLGIEVLLASEYGALHSTKPVGWISATKDAADEVRRQVKRNINGIIRRQVTQSKLELINGGVIYFFSADDMPKSMPQLGLVVVDDARKIPDLLLFMDDYVLEAIREFSGSAWFLSTPFGKRCDFYRVFDAAKGDPDWSCWQFSSSLNPNLPEDTKTAISMASELELAQRFNAEFLDVPIELSSSQRIIGENESFIDWCRRLAADGLKVDGKPFSLDNRPALIPIYEAIPTHKKDAKDLTLIIQKATQLGLTIWEVLANIYMAIKWGPVSIGMFMPAMATAMHKSEHRFMRIVRSSPSLYKILTHGTDINGKEKKVGEGNVLTRRVSDSLLLFLWTTGKVTTESIPMDVVTLDECQEMTLEQIDKVRARTGDSDVQFTMMLSTANIDEQDINFWYRRGNQQVWHTRCEHCGAESDLSDPSGIFPSKSIGYSTGDVPGVEKNEYYWRCPECEGPISDPQQGRYIVTNPGASPKMLSFLLPRTISPKLTPRKMIEAWLGAKTGNQKKSFYNRTLARPYIDSDQLPVSMSHCLAAAEEGMRLGLRWKKSGRECFAGIDQMGSFNAIIIKERLPDGRQAVVHVEAIFNDDPFERCSELMDQFGVAVCVVEQLPNVNDARRFANRHSGRVFLAGYADLRDDQMQWGDQISRSDNRTNEEDRTRFTVTLNQYKCMQTALYRIKNRHCLFPDPDALEQDVIDGGVKKRIKLLRDWVFFHFTKTALVVDTGDSSAPGKAAKHDVEARKVRTKVVKVGIDPHYSYANMLCDVAWARAHGTSTFIMPDPVQPEGMPKEPPRAVKIPSSAGSALEEIKIQQMADDTCGKCRFRNPENDFCSELQATVRPSDPGCLSYEGRGY